MNIKYKDFRKIFALICFFQYVWRNIVYRKRIKEIKEAYGDLLDSGFWIMSGHDFVEQNDGSLKCEICGKVSK